jgi:hypothetical protein
MFKKGMSEGIKIKFTSKAYQELLKWISSLAGMGLHPFGG